MVQDAAARSRVSSLNSIRSSRLPPPRAMIKTSGRGIGPPGARLEQDGAGEAARDGGFDVLEDRALGRGDDADDGGQNGNGAFAGEQAFRGEFDFQGLDAGEQGASTRIFQALDDELVFRAFRIGGEAAGGDDFDAVFGFQADSGGGTLPDDGADFGTFVFQGEILVAGAVGFEFRDFAAHAHAAEGGFEGFFHGPGEVRDGEFGGVGGQVAHGGRLW